MELKGPEGLKNSQLVTSMYCLKNNSSGTFNINGLSFLSSNTIVTDANNISNRLYKRRRCA